LFSVKKALDRLWVKHYSGEPITESGARDVSEDEKRACAPEVTEVYLRYLDTVARLKKDEKKS